MSNIFADTQPPAWLVNITRPAPKGEMGELAGMGLAGLFNAYQDSKATKDKADVEASLGQPPEETKSWLQEIPQGLAEARLNLADPLWKVKMAQTGAVIAQHRATAQLAYQKADLQAHMAETETADAPVYAQYLKDKAADPHAPRPTFQSLKYNALADKTDQATQADETKRQAVKNKLDADTLKAQNDAEKLDILKKNKEKLETPPEIITKTLSDGTKINLLWQKATGYTRELKTTDEASAAALKKESNRIRSKIVDANGKLAAAKTGKDKGAIAAAQALVDAYKAELSNLQTSPDVGASTKIGRFDVQVKP